MKCDFFVYTCSAGRGRENSVTSVVMMYSPDIPAASRRGNTTENGKDWLRRGSSDVYCSALANYYARIETEESAKCVVSTALFCLVLLAFVLVAILMNPEM